MDTAVFPKAAKGLDEEDLPAVLMLIALAAMACMLPAQADTFYHLRSGREMWQTGWLLTRERFSWTAFGQPLPNHWWLSQLVFYGLYSAGGPFLLTVVAGACAFAAVFLSWRLTAGSIELRVLLLTMLLMTTTEWSVRPQVFSLLFLMLTVRLVLADRLAWVPLLLVLWANMHAVVILGVAVAGAAALDACIWDRSRARRAVLVAIASAAAPMVSPLGVQYWPWVLRTVSVSKAIGLQEYASAFQVSLPAVMLWIVVAALAFFAIRAMRTPVIRDRRARLLVMIAALFAPGAIASMRNIPFFLLVAAPALSSVIVTKPIGRRRAPGRAMIAMIAVGVVVASGVVAVRWSDGGARLGWRPMTPAAIAAVRSCPAPIYNGFYEGGALIWFVPEQRVFMDGRVDVYQQDFLLRGRRADLEGDYKSLFADYGIRCAVVSSRSPIAQALRADASMRLRFADDAWAVFVRDAHF